MKRPEEADHMEFDWQLLCQTEEPFPSLRTAEQRNTFPPVILFEGKEGLGKRAIALFAAALGTCETNSACSICYECKRVLAQDHPEIKVFHGEEAFTVEQASEVQEHLSFHPQTSQSQQKVYRTAVIINAERMTIQAANRLLKLFEETHEHSRILLTTAKATNLPNTILSRCCRLRVKQPSHPNALAILEQILGAHGEKVSKDELTSALETSGYAPWAAAHNWEARRQIQSLQNTLKKFLDAPNPSIDVMLSLCEENFRKSAQSVQEFISAFEMALNHSYRTFFIEQARGPVDFQLITKRRQLLRDLRLYSEKKKIRLNAQLAAEHVLSAGMATRKTWNM